ncbi:MAG TPA: VWA domain-containing protein [Acidobacteriaceae bacterium]|nr:VWA domain-containing protein [Acidobacteriaceae bacterium]
MVFGRQSIGAVVLAVALAGAAPAGGGQQTSQQNTSQTAQQNMPNAPTPGIPNAPAPQTLPQLNTITPPAPMAPEPPAAQTNPDAADNGGITPTNKLPSTAAPSPGQQEQAPMIPAAGQAAQAAYTLGVVHVDFVQIPFTVKDSKNQFVPDLSWRDVRVYENNVRQHIQYWSPDPFPLSVAFVIDQSVSQDTMDKINASLSALQGAFAPYDEVAVYTYNNGVKEQTTFTAAQSNRLGVALERSKSAGRQSAGFIDGPLSQTTIKNNQPVDPNTQPIRNQSSIYQTPEKEFHPLFDAMFTAAQSLAKVDIKRRRVLYVISDGKEYGSTVKEKELIRYLQTNNISVYATIVGNSALPGMGFLDRIHLPMTMRDDALPRIATVTGGQCDPEWRPRGIENSFADITKTVRTLYTVGYYTHENPLDGRFRHVEVRVMRPNLTVISPDGYYPRPRNVHQAQPVAGTDQTPHSDNQPVTPASPPATQP